MSSRTQAHDQQAYDQNEALRDSEQRFQAIFEQAAVGIAHLDTEGRWLLVNQRLCDIVGYTCAELLQRRFQDITYPDDIDADLDYGRRILAGEIDTYSLEKRYIRKDGSSVWVNLTASLARDSLGAPDYFIVFVEDIDERKRAQEEIERRARQQEAVAQFGLRALSGADLSTLMDEAVVLVARTLDVEFCKLLELLPDGKEMLLRAGVGWRAGLVGRTRVRVGTGSQAGYSLASDEPIIVKDLRTEARVKSPALLHEHGVISGITVIIRGSERPWGVIGAHSTRQRDFDQDDLHFMQAIANVLAMAIERKRVEESVEHHQADVEALNERLQRAMRETHHRVKNNLQIISAMVDLRLMQYAGEIPADEFKRLGAYVRTLATVHDILTEEARQGGRRESISAIAILEKLMPLMQATAGGRQINFAMDEIWLPARQATALAIIINELVSNALKHSGGDVHLSLRIQDKSAVLQVCDDGPGFPPGFDPATSAHTGLDLIDSLSRWDLGGSTSYQNRPEGGACARVTIPLPAPAQVEKRIHHHTESPSPQSRKSPARQYLH